MASPQLEAKNEAKTKTSPMDQFKEEFAGLVEEHILQDSNMKEIPEDLKEWVRELCKYNVPFGKLNRGMTVVAVAQALGGDARKAMILGWCVEWLQAFFLVADDVMDESVTRRGQPCWYKKPGVGLLAVNDSFILEAIVYRMLKKHFRGEPFYLRLLELFLDVSHKTELGQMADMLAEQSVDRGIGSAAVEAGAAAAASESAGGVVAAAAAAAAAGAGAGGVGAADAAPGGELDLERYTAERHAMIVKYKTAFYTFYLPVALGMTVSGVDDDAAYAKVEKICISMGEYFQVQDDVLDAFADPAVLGKVGTDIQDGKCSWLVVQAKRLSSASQLEVLRANYGRNRPECIAAVKALYADLELQKLYDDYEAKVYAELCDTIGGGADSGDVALPETLQAPLLGLLNKIHKRKK